MITSSPAHRSLLVPRFCIATLSQQVYSLTNPCLWKIHQVVKLEIQNVSVNAQETFSAKLKTHVFRTVGWTCFVALQRYLEDPVQIHLHINIYIYMCAYIYIIYILYCIVLYLSIYIAPLNSHGQTEALLVQYHIYMYIYIHCIYIYIY